MNEGKVCLIERTHNCGKNLLFGRFFLLFFLIQFDVCPVKLRVSRRFFILKLASASSVFWNSCGSLRPRFRTILYDFIEKSNWFYIFIPKVTKKKFQKFICVLLLGKKVNRKQFCVDLFRVPKWQINEIHWISFEVLIIQYWFGISVSDSSFNHSWVYYVLRFSD